MIVQCPECRSKIRLQESDQGDRVVKYLCNKCQRIVRIDLVMDELKSSSSSGSFEALDIKKKILIADDTKLIREVASRVLQEAGFTVIMAEDGEQALEQIRDEHPDLVLMDLLMPRMTGFDVLREVKRQDRLKDTLFLVMSSVYKKNVMKFLHQVGVQGFLDKENLRDSLLFRVKTILQEASPH